MKYQVLLFYKYMQIEDPEAEKFRQESLFSKYKLTGRMIVSKEGINGTLEGEVEDTEKYIEEMTTDKRFADIHWKRSEGYGDAFKKAKIKVRDEIVALGLGENDINPNQTTGKYISAGELHNLYESGKEFYVVDMRNDYEQKLGHFRNALLMPMGNFRDLPEKLTEISHLKDKMVVTTCTGGIRCEKASGFLIENGFTNVFQLFGGMHTYMEKYPNKHFLGKLYVFDRRVVWGVNTDENVSFCDRCGEPSDNYIDCAYLHCARHRHSIVCKKHVDENGLYFCSDECKQAAYTEEKFFADAVHAAE